MKANNINGTIKLFGQLPNQWRNQLNFRKSTIEVQEQEGFFDVVTPEFDFDIQKLGNIYFDADASVFTYPIIDQVLDIEAIRAEKHEVFQQILEQEMTPALMFGVLEKLAMGEPIPQETIATITALRNREAQVKSDIDSETDVNKLTKFGFDKEEIDQSKELLKAGRNL